MIRITGGILKGIRLQVPGGLNVRPTTDRVRQTIFNILGKRVQGASVMDLFAGTGSLGIEALSRGASRSVFVEKNKKISLILKENIIKCGLEDLALVLPISVEKAFTLLKEPFDLIFADPPYKEVSLLHKILGPVMSLVKSDGVVVVEHDEKSDFVFETTGDALRDRRKIGNTVVSFLCSGRIM